MGIHDEAEAARRAVYDAEFDRRALELAALQTRLDVAVSQAEAAEARVVEQAGELDAQAVALGEKDTEIAELRERIRVLEEELEVDPPVDPVAPGATLKAYTTLAQLLADKGLPADLKVAVWTPADGGIVAWSRRVASDVVLVVPAGVDPALMRFDSSKGFRASDTVAMEYISDEDYLTKGLVPKDNPNAAPKPYSAKYVTGMTPVEPTSGHWFSMLRTGGIIVLDPGVVIAPTESGYKGQRQPKESMGVYDARDTAVPKRLFLKVGSQQKMIESVSLSPVFANLRLDGTADGFGTIAHTALAAGKAGGLATIRDVVVGPTAWYGFAGIPNGEAGGVAIGGRYDIDGLTLEADEARSSSPIMWNRSEGGTARRVEIGKHRIGMITFWRSRGVNIFEDFVTNAGTVGINLEEEEAGFELEWRGGAIRCVDGPTVKHVNLINSAEHTSSVKLRFIGVEYAGDSGYAPGKLVVHRTGRAGVQKRSDITSDSFDIAYVGSGWID